MALFGRWKRKSGLSPMDEERMQHRIAQQPPSSLVPPFLLPDKVEFITAMQEMDLDRVLSIYQSAEPSHRYRHMQNVGDALYADTVATRGLAQAWLERLERPTSPQQRILLASICQAVGWHERGSDFASMTSFAGLESFEDSLLTAIPLLLSAGQELGNTDIVPFLLAQDCGYVLDYEDGRALSQYWRALDPWHQHGIRRLGYLADRRWSGQDHAWFMLAQEIVNGAPAGSGSLAVVAELVLERWDYLTVFADLTRAEADEETVAVQPVQQLVVAAYQRLFDCGTIELDPAEQVRALNYFAWVFYWADLLELAHHAMMQIRGRVNQYAWEIREDEGGTAVAEFDHARDYLIRRVEFGVD